MSLPRHIQSFHKTGKPLVPIAIAVMVIISLVLPELPVHADPRNPLPPQPGFEGGKVLGGAGVTYSSPTLADLTGNGKLDIIVGGRDGMVYAVDANGVLLWQFNAAAAINAVVPFPSTTGIESAPAVGDLDGDGWPEVVISATGDPSTKNGGVLALERTGELMPGWPQVNVDVYRDGFVDGFYSSPALGDLDGDGDLEIVAGSWGMHIYAWHHDGTLVAGWPKFAGDTIWSSPALADLDQDGQLEVIIGSDGHFDGLCTGGGCLNVFRGDGSMVPGFPKPIDQTIYSSPAIADLNGDGWLDIVVGTGNFYGGKGYAIYAWDRFGNLLPGWPVPTGGYVMSAPSVGDIDGDGQPEVVVGCNDGKAYAVNGNGTYVPGWPVTVYDNWALTNPLYYASPVLANFDGDAQPEVHINLLCDTVVLDGNGQHLTHSEAFGNTGKPTMYVSNGVCECNTPAVADIDLDGKLEVVRAAGTYLDGGRAVIYVWESGAAPTDSPWPMFRADPMHDATYPRVRAADARIAGHTLPSIMHPGQTMEVFITVENTGSEPWLPDDLFRLGSAEGDPFVYSTRALLTPDEAVAPGEQTTFAVTLDAPSAEGYFTTEWRMLEDGAYPFGLGVSHQIKVGDEPAYYVLSKDGSGPGGGVYAGGLAPGLPPATHFTAWHLTKAVQFSTDGKGYQLLDYQGGVWQSGTAVAIGGHGFVPQAVDILLRHGDTTYYILDAYGRLIASYGAYPITPAPPTFGSPIVRSAALTADSRGVYVLDGYGTIYTGGTAPPLSPAIPGLGSDIAKRIKLTKDGTGYYVLDAYGRLWNGGTAPPLAPDYAYHVGEDWARDFELTEDGLGYYLLDKEGRVHTGGTAVPPTQNLTPVWSGQDMALDLELVDSRALGAPSVSADYLVFLSTPDRPQSQTVALSSSNGSALNWSAETDQGWIESSPSSGVLPAAITVSVDPAHTGIGIHEGRVLLYSDGPVSDPIEVAVELHVVEHLYTTYLPMIGR